MWKAWDAGMLEFRSQVLTNQILHGYVLNSGTGALLVGTNTAASDSTSVQIFSLGGGGGGNI